MAKRKTQDGAANVATPPAPKVDAWQESTWIDGVEYVLVPRITPVHANKDVRFDMDAREFAGPLAFRTFFGRATANVAGDAVSDPKYTAGAVALARVLSRRALWYKDPEGSVRGEADPFLNAMRDAAYATGRIKKRTDARVATLEGLKVLFGPGWDVVSARIRAKVDADRAARESLATELASALAAAEAEAAEGTEEEENDETPDWEGPADPDE